jgi:hypothetical protein
VKLLAVVNGSTRYLHPLYRPNPVTLNNLMERQHDGGKIVDTVIKAIIDRTDGLHYQIDFGNEPTSLTSGTVSYAKNSSPT